MDPSLMPSLICATLSDDDRPHVGPRMSVPRVWAAVWFARALEAYDPADAAFWDVLAPAL